MSWPDRWRRTNSLPSHGCRKVALRIVTGRGVRG